MVKHVVQSLYRLRYLSSSSFTLMSVANRVGSTIIFVVLLNFIVPFLHVQGLL